MREPVRAITRAFQTGTRHRERESSLLAVQHLVRFGLLDVSSLFEGDAFNRRRETYDKANCWIIFGESFADIIILFFEL